MVVAFKSKRQRIFREQWGFLRQDWEPIKEILESLLEFKLLALFGLLIFLPAVVVEFIFTLAVVILGIEQKA
jgi:hypothetical protein